MAAKKSNERNEETFVYEFGGVLGAVFMIIGLPIGTYYLTACAFYGHVLYPTALSVAALQHDVITPLLQFITTQCQLDWVAFKIYSFWFFMQIVADRILSGEIVYGQPVPELKDKCLKYKMNGWKAWLFTHLLLILVLVQSPSLIGIIVDKLYNIMTIAQLYALGMAILAHVVGVSSGLGCRLSGNFVYDFWMGYARVPRIGDFDIKLFCEARPGLQLWIVIDFVLFYHHWQTEQRFDAQMFAIFAMQWWYITDYFWFEDAILTTMDLIHDKFGFMLSFGDIVWVPFTYTLQMQCLFFYYQRHPKSTARDDGMLWCWLTAAFVIFIVGYILFRQSNLQKHRFRQMFARKQGHNAKSAPTSEYKIWGRDVQYIQTQRGTKLLVSGWWGICRHINYTGDWLMSTAQSLCCDNFTFCAPPSSILVYFNPIYFAILLIHRERRDNLRCQMKYAADWDKYCEKVPARLIPYIY